MKLVTSKKKVGLHKNHAGCDFASLQQTYKVSLCYPVLQQYQRK